MIQDRPSRGPLPLLTSKKRTAPRRERYFYKKNARRLDGSDILKGRAPISESILGSILAILLDPVLDVFLEGFFEVFLGPVLA